MNAHEFLFGDKFDRCVGYIIDEACKENTREAYKLAQSKLHGILTLTIFISSEGGTPMPTAHLMLRNEMNNLQRIIDTPNGCLERKKA
jgi:hypothetical protein